MSETIIEKLLKGANVEWIQLGERLKRTTGTSITAGKMRELHKSYGPLKIFGGGKTYALVNFNDIPAKDINKHPSIIVKSRGIIEFDYYDKPFSHKNELWSYHSEDNDICIKYIYYYMKTKEAYFQHLGNKMQMPQISIQDTDKFPVPLPPLSVQKEIVRILDAFTSHTAELTAELNQRKKQYNYYRDKLLTFSDDEVEWKPLGEVCEFSYGYVAKAQARGDTRFIRISDISNSGKLLTKDAKYVDLTTENKKFVLKKGDLLMARTGATFGKTMYFNEDYRAIYAGFLIKINFLKKQVLSKYYWHVAQSKIFWDQANRLVSGGGQPQFNVNVLKNVIIPIPSIEQQKRIVSILDRFDTLTNSISDGLPKEIELRNKQYEYYRDQLLNFPKPENNAIKQSPANI